MANLQRTTAPPMRVRRGYGSRITLTVVFSKFLILLCALALAFTLVVSWTWAPQNHLILGPFRGWEAFFSDNTSAGCDSECLRFRQLMKPISRGGSWPDDKPRAAIVVLFGDWLINSGGVFARFTQNIDHYFNNQFRYPIVAFYNASHQYMNSTVHQMLRNQTRSDVFFQPVEFTVPDFVNLSQIDDNRCWGLKNNGIGYRSMCRFHAKTIYEQEIMKADTLEFVWRLDDDSRLTKEVIVDPFRTMRDSNFKYGYYETSNETQRCAIGLWSTVENYWRKRGVKPRFDLPEPVMFFNNFEVSSISLWRSKEYLDYINYIDSLGEFYYSRWGDSPVKSLAVNRILSLNEIHRFEEMGYTHGDRSLRWFP